MCTGNVCRQRVTRQPRRTLHRLGKLLSVETHDALRSSESEVMHNASRTVIHGNSRRVVAVNRSSRQPLHFNVKTRKQEAQQCQLFDIDIIW